MSRYLGGVRTAEQTKASLDATLAHWDRHGFGLWEIRDPAGAFMGRAGVRHLDVQGVDEIEIAYHAPIAYMLASPIPYDGGYKELAGGTWLVEDKARSPRAGTRHARARLALLAHAQ